DAAVPTEGTNTPPVAVAPLNHYDTTAWENAMPQQAGSPDNPRAAAPKSRQVASASPPPAQVVSPGKPPEMPPAQPSANAPASASPVLYPTVNTSQDGA